MKKSTLLAILVLGILLALAAPGHIRADQPQIEDRLSSYIDHWMSVRPHHPARKHVPEIATWIVQAASMNHVNPWEVLFVCTRESSLIPRDGTHGEKGPGQLHGLALSRSMSEVGGDVEQLSQNSPLAYRAVAYWLAQAKRACPNHPYGQYHSGRCADCFYDRDVRRELEAVR